MRNNRIYFEDYVKIDHDVHLKSHGRSSNIHIRKKAILDRGVDTRSLDNGLIDIGQNTYISPCVCIAGSRLIKIVNHCLVASRTEILSNSFLIEFTSLQDNICMKICYFIQTHKNPKQIIKLVKAIQDNSSNSHIVISHDFSSSTLDVTTFNNLYNISIITRNKPARRGDSSILNIYLQVIDYLLQRQINFDWLVTLSGQDYPIQPLYKLENLLKTTQYDGFLDYYDFADLKQPLEKRKDSIKRYTGQYMALPYWSQPLLNQVSKFESFIPFLRVQAYCTMIGIKSWSTPFNKNFIPYRGYYWNTLSKECIIYFKNILESYPKILKYYQKTLAPEESIIATVLVNSKRFNFSQNIIQYADFPFGLRGFGANLVFEDLEQIIQQNYFFARKFDLDKNPQIFDFIDHELLFNYQK